MNDDRSKLPDDLRLRFPDLRPVKRAPSLIRINGIGTGMYGHRDTDSETGTYVKTHCLCFLFVPLISLGAYRVADAEQGWYFIGKERLSPLAKSWNWAMLACAILLSAGIAQHIRTSSPDYRAQQDLKQAAELMQSGKPLPAARTYAKVATGPARADEGGRGLRESLEQCLNSDSPQTVEGAFQLASSLARQRKLPEAPIPDALQRGTALVGKFRGKDPEGALGILRATSAFAATNATVRPVEIDLLKSILAANPGNSNRAVELALIYENDHNVEESCKVLLPVKQHLGSTEGARILGQCMLQEGNYNDAYALLFPYVQTRLQQLRVMEKNYTNAIAAAYRRGIDSLNRNEADRSFYSAYETASKAEREAMVEAYVEKRLETDPELRRARMEFASANRIVHVTLDLGIVQLNRAQTLENPAARKTELEAAEKTFLAIRGLADMSGTSDEYRLFLGQVYYWLGKSREGKELFDELLASGKREYHVVMSLATTLRQVGEEAQARDLSEEAYRTTTKKEEKYRAASLRARLQKDAADQIVWLEKCDPVDPVIQVELNSARGEKALHDGDRDLAAQSFRKAIAGYEKLPRNSPAALNNFGLVYLSLYAVTGDMKDQDRGLDLLQQAVALDPGNSLLLMNTAQQLFTRAHMDAIGDTIRYGVLKQNPDRDMLGYLYQDEAGRAQVYQRLRENDYMKKALAYLDKALLLAPKNAGLYWAANRNYKAFRDLPELQKLLQRLQTASPDLTEAKQSSRDYYSGVRDTNYLARLKSEIGRLETLVETAAVKEHALSLEFVRVELIGCRQGLALYGVPVDGQKILDEARAIHQLHHDSASLGALIGAAFFKADEDLRQQNPEYAQLAQTTRHALGPRLLIASVLARDNSLAKNVGENANVRQALQFTKEYNQRFPASRTPEDWALFRATDPDEAARAIQHVKEDQVTRIASEIEFELNPLSSSAVLEQCWLRKISGDEAGASKIYQEAVKNGVPLPPL